MLIKIQIHLKIVVYTAEYISSKTIITKIENVTMNLKHSV